MDILYQKQQVKSRKIPVKIEKRQCFFKTAMFNLKNYIKNLFLGIKKMGVGVTKQVSKQVTKKVTFSRVF
jgi:hypothetical protein